MMSIWLLRCKPEWKNRIKEFREKNIIAIGWPAIQLHQGMSPDDIEALLGTEYDYQTEGGLIHARATIDMFVNRMQIGDIVLVPDGDDIYFAEVVSDYRYDSSFKADGYPHQRDVKWLLEASRKTLSDALRSSLRTQGTIANLSHHANEIENLC